MTDTAESSLVAAATERPPFYRDATVVKWLVQVVTLAVVLFALVFLASEAGDNLEAKDINTGFDFLSIDPGINVGDGIDTDPDTGGRALWVGMVNTIRLSVAGIFVATILGVVIGVARLSNNWIAAKVASVFIEYMRNIPLLVHILLFFTVLGTLGNFGRDTEPILDAAGNPLLDENGDALVEITQGPINGWIHVSNKGLSLPRVHIADGFYQWMIFILIGFFIGRYVMKQRQAQQDATGAETYPILSLLGVMAVFGIIGWFLHPIFGWVGDAIFDPIARAIPNVPEQVVQVLLSVLALGAAALWIKRFLDSRRTPAGLAKLTDDDWFRMIFAGVSAVIAAIFFLVVWPGLSSWIINSSRDFFEVAADKFGDGRGNWREDWPIDAARPDIEKRGNFANPGPAGLNFSQGFAAVFFGVVLYTAAFVAEIVRGGILAVPKGQTEAAQAVGLKRATMLRRVILPQAFRVSLPPLGNQYLNLTKNTSLAIAVGYSDIVQVGSTIFNQTGRSLEVFGIWMLFYLACSLTISAVVNFFNVRLKIVER
ncbi:MAG: ABC transporter permease subunit [Actinomycetota bacterium]